MSKIIVTLEIRGPTLTLEQVNAWAKVIVVNIEKAPDLKADVKAVTML